MISAEETSAEVVMAIRDSDPTRFGRSCSRRRELKSLGLNSQKAKGAGRQGLAAAPATFRQSAPPPERDQPKSTGSTSAAIGRAPYRRNIRHGRSDLVVYENVVAIVDTEGKDAQVLIGTMIKVGDCWRLIDAPTVPDAGNASQSEVAGSGFFFVNPSLKNVGAADGIGRRQLLTRKHRS